MADFSVTAGEVNYLAHLIAVAETKATRATDLGRRQGYPLLFTTEPEE